jgi:hypothetical protein
MPNADDALARIDTLKPSLAFEWVNVGRVSEDWKAKRFQQRGSGFQFAVYNRRTSICVLLEHDVEGISGANKLGQRPKSDSLKKAGSKFANVPGSCYRIDDVGLLERLLRAYLSP